MITITERKAKESAKEYVVRTLMDNIVTLQIKPGEQLLESGFCEQLHVSRTPFREGLLELSRRLLVDIRPKIGTYVSYIDPDLVSQVGHLRIVLECELARMACEQFTQDQIDQLMENLAVWPIYIRKNQPDRILVLDQEFHLMMYQMCARRFWYELVGTYSPHYDRAAGLCVCRYPMEELLHGNERLLAAIEQRDVVSARRIVEENVRRYTKDLNVVREEFPAYFR
ncbi:MAG: GntR family transcriptional regulator [Clostridiales bacterium]|nr:GntR family transcriptional regulator [Clostridiales bacterium]